MDSTICCLWLVADFHDEGWLYNVQIQNEISSAVEILAEQCFGNVGNGRKWIFPLQLLMPQQCMS
jgi:hypothetical protein